MSASIWFRLTRGQVVFVKVVEVQEATGLLVTYRGELLLVSNQSNKEYSQGDVLRLRVGSISPLSFTIEDSSVGLGRLRLSV